MKSLKAFKTLLPLTALIAFTALTTISCSDKNIDVDIDNPGADTSGDDTYYMAVRIYNAAAIGTDTRADADNWFDSDDEDKNSNDKTFNQGLASENAIFTSYSSADDSPHFILVFGEDTNKKLEYILPLYDWDTEKNQSDDSPYETVENNYYTYYTSAQKSSLPSNINNRTLLMVLNAGDKLKADLKSKLKTATYSDILEMKIGDDSTDNTDYLFFTDPDTEIKYFTMSSSMVIPATNQSNGLNAGEYGGAVIRRNYTWYPDKETAAKQPVFSFFVERTQAKYTLLFKHMKNGVEETCFFSLDDDVTTARGYVPVKKLILTSGVDFDAKDDNNNSLVIQYVTDYTRSESITSINSVKVKSTTNWKINITGWCVNGVEKNEYLFKKLTAGTNYYNNWNIDALSPYRNFWAEGADYTGGWFPDQYRAESAYDSIGMPQKNLTPYFENKATASLIYNGFKSMSQKFTHQYAPEHTITKTSYSKSDPVKSNEILRNNTHIIVTAQMLLGPSNTNLTGANYDGLDRYDIYNSQEVDSEGLVYSTDAQNQKIDANCKLYMNNVFWTETAYKAYVVEYLGYMMLTDENQSRFGSGHTYTYTDESKQTHTIPNVYYPNDGVIYVTRNEYTGRPGEQEPEPASGVNFELGHVNMEYGDNVVFIKPTQQVHLYIRNANYDPTATGEKIYNRQKFIEITNKELFKILALEHREYFAQHFKSGRMYYAIPIDHVVNSSSNDLEIDGKIYGSVRNHWYRFTINSINHIGTAVDDQNNPIVPNNLPAFDALGVEMTVLPWHTISTDVDITGQRPQLNPDEIDIDLYMKADDWYYEGIDKDL